MSASQSAWVIDVGQGDFEREVIERSKEKPVVVDFWAPWCQPCRLLGPVLEKLVAERNGEVILAKVNVDEAQELALHYRVEAIPAVKAFRDGRPVWEFEGLLPEPQLRDFLDRLRPSEADGLAAQAYALEADRPAEAEALYRRALEGDRNHEKAAVGLARALVAQGRDGEARELLTGVGFSDEQREEAERLEAVLWLREQAGAHGSETEVRRRLEADPDNPRLLLELGTALAAAGRYPEALERLLAGAERDAKLAREKVREVMVKVFHAVGARSALADEYRQKLSRVLY